MRAVFFAAHTSTRCRSLVFVARLTLCSSPLLLPSHPQHERRKAHACVSVVMGGRGPGRTHPPHSQTLPAASVDSPRPATAQPNPPTPPFPYSGVNIKTRKRNIAVALDPASFADAVVSIFADARADGDADGEAWLAAGLPALQTADLDFSRYGDTLFEVLFAGGRMSAGGAVVDDGRPTLDRAYLAPGVPEDSIGAFVAAFQALLR